MKILKKIILIIAIMYMISFGGCLPEYITNPFEEYDSVAQSRVIDKW